MGGNALKTIQAQRLDSETYNIISKEILQILGNYYLKVSIPAEKPGKKEHGDIDVICLLKPGEKPFDAISELNSKESTRNGHIISFEYKGHQIDIIHVSTLDEFHFSTFFYSNGDMGMILGMMCKTIGLALGDRLFKLHLPHPLHEKSLILTKDITLVLAFLGLDAKIEFSSVNEVFKWITSSRFFRPQMFFRDELLGKQRKRDKERPMFKQFVEYCNNLDNFDNSIKLRDPIDSLDVFREAIVFFDKTEEYEKLYEEKTIANKVKAKFSGILVMEWTGVKSGATIGKIISLFRQQYTDQNILDMEKGELESHTLRIFNSLQNQSPKSI